MDKFGPYQGLPCLVHRQYFIDGQFGGVVHLLVEDFHDHKGRNRKEQFVVYEFPQLEIHHFFIGQTENPIVLFVQQVSPCAVGTVFFQKEKEDLGIENRPLYSLGLDECQNVSLYKSEIGVEPKIAIAALPHVSIVSGDRKFQYCIDDLGTVGIVRIPGYQFEKGHKVQQFALCQYFSFSTVQEIMSVK